MELKKKGETFASLLNIHGGDIFHYLSVSEIWPDKRDDLW